MDRPCYSNEINDSQSLRMIYFTTSDTVRKLRRGRINHMVDNDFGYFV